MSIKNNFNYIKNEISSDGQLLENTLKLEILYKKYKYIIWTILVVVIFGGISYQLYSYYNEKKIQKYSALYSELLQDTSNTSLQAELKTGNPKLYDLFTLQQALKDGNISKFMEIQDSKSAIISSISSYYIGSFERDISVLKNVNKYTLGDLSKLQQAYILINENKINDAKVILGEISKDSNISELASLLSHYMITKQ
ncbi:hypothetical protein [Helicobacter sp. MIT 99-5507]|uniref:hypothetical protein n=1 Tax=Helicobacter sp. MIT 99-5507 TaxID=152489 RepID=UPI000E1F3C7D|nr:hypothetical protein [Helicobacter sp. MIT 99-5507]RDU57339.1 hypothetical protein CQA42_05195 [Helicobacter sp. MIT 99-5507]